MKKIVIQLMHVNYSCVCNVFIIFWKWHFMTFSFFLSNKNTEQGTAVNLILLELFVIENEKYHKSSNKYFPFLNTPFNIQIPYKI